MKRFSYTCILALIFLFSFSKTYSQSSIIGNPIKIGNIEVAQYDFRKIPWVDANNSCMSLGDGWRLPTIDELKILYQNRESIGNFKWDSYWSSTKGNVVIAWRLNFGDGMVYDRDNTDNTACVRAVRNSIINTTQLNEQKTETYQNGDKYVGEMKNRMRYGQGTYTFSNGEKYVGEWKDGFQNGQGTYMYSNGDKYVGEWKDGSRNGHGTHTFSNGAEYIGNFKDNQWNGYGTFTSFNKDIKKGTWENGNYIEGKKEVVVLKNQTNNNSFKPTYKEIPNSASIIGNPIKIGNLLVAEFDFPEKMNWEDAYNSCFSLGKGWRLPTKLELNILYNNLNKIGDVANDGYWTSTENGNERAWRQYLFKEGYSYDDVKYGSGYVRAVGNYGVVKIVPSKTKKSNTNVPSGIIDGVSQQDLLNALFADDLKPSSQKSNNSSSSSSNKTINSNSTKKNHEFNVIVQWQKTCGNCPFPSPSIQNGVLLSQPSPRGGYYNLQPICPICGKKPYGELSGNTNNMIGGSKTFKVVCKGN